MLISGDTRLRRTIQVRRIVVNCNARGGFFVSDDEADTRPFRLLQKRAKKYQQENNCTANARHC
jgi:hypothetical protein